MHSLWFEFFANLLHICSMATIAIIFRWLLNLSTPTQDWHTVKASAEWAYDSLRIPDWREWFNMDRLTRLRTHPDVPQAQHVAVIIVEVPDNEQPSGDNG